MSLLMFKAIADETRARLIHILFHYELSVNELVRILGMGQSRVSRHLKILAEAGLLRFRRDGLWVFYSAPCAGEKLEFLRAVMPYLASMRHMEGDLDLAAQILEERARRTRQFFNAIADDWDDLNNEVLGDFNLPGHVLEALPSTSRVAVDLGCGTGIVLEALLSRVPRVIGVDGSARMLDLCRGRLGAADSAPGAVSLRIGELSHLPLADHEADFACINLVLHHLGRPAEIFTEIRRILVPGGILFIADFLRHNDEEMRRRYGDHWLGFDPAEVQTGLLSAGFTIHRLERHPVGRGLSLFVVVCQSAPTDPAG